MTEAERRVIIIGGGPAGLTAACQLVRSGLSPLVLEQLDKVGGLARTEQFEGHYFDMGGHRFFTKVGQVNRMWREVLGDDFIRRPRLSRIFYGGTYFYYPLRPVNVLAGLGLIESMRIGLSFLRWQILPHRREETFEQWVTNRFGKRLFETFFKTYTEKVWGIPCSELKAEWAAQRIKDLSMRTALMKMFSSRPSKVKTLIEEFDYPRLGPGMMWRAFREKIERGGGEVRLNCRVSRICRQGRAVQAVEVTSGSGKAVFEGTDFISSMPVTQLIRGLDPPPPESVLQAAQRLKYRDFLTVCLIVAKPDLFPDNWIYIHDPGARVGRIQNFKNWSPDMVPDPSRTSLGLEYFCNQGDDLWMLPDQELIELGKQDLMRIGLAQPEDVLLGCVFRVPQAYPVYDSDYRSHLLAVRKYVDSLKNLQTIGRNGLHRYNNQDHAMLTGILAVRNLLSGEDNDLWSVNTDQEYLEETDS